MLSLLVMGSLHKRQTNPTADPDAAEQALGVGGTASVDFPNAGGGVGWGAGAGAGAGAGGVRVRVRVRVPVRVGWVRVRCGCRVLAALLAARRIMADISHWQTHRG